MIQWSKGKVSCLEQVSNSHTPYGGEFYGDVLHERIIGAFRSFGAILISPRSLT